MSLIARINFAHDYCTAHRLNQTRQAEESASLLIAAGENGELLGSLPRMELLLIHARTACRH